MEKQLAKGPEAEITVLEPKRKDYPEVLMSIAGDIEVTPVTYIPMWRETLVVGVQTGFKNENN